VAVLTWQFRVDGLEVQFGVGSLELAVWKWQFGVGSFELAV